MKGIFKIEEYFPDRNSISVKFCRPYSQKPIDEYTSRFFSCDDLDFYDAESFADSLMTKFGERRIEKQERKNGILEENKPVKVTDKFDIRDLIGKVIIGGSDRYRASIKIKMRKVDL